MVQIEKRKKGHLHNNNNNNIFITVSGKYVYHQVFFNI